MAQAVHGAVRQGARRAITEQAIARAPGWPAALMANSIDEAIRVDREHLMIKIE
jgi:hypothetical protein